MGIFVCSAVGSSVQLVWFQIFTSFFVQENYIPIVSWASIKWNTNFPLQTESENYTICVSYNYNVIHSRWLTRLLIVWHNNSKTSNNYYEAGQAFLLNTLVFNYYRRLWMLLTPKHEHCGEASGEADTPELHQLIMPPLYKACWDLRCVVVCGGCGWKAATERGRDNNQIKCWKCELCGLSCYKLLYNCFITATVTTTVGTPTVC